jgi:hypothetical protein
MEGSVRRLTPTHPVNIPCGRKPVYPEKPTTLGRALTDSFHISVMDESIVRIIPTISEVSERHLLSCSDNCATKAPNEHSISACLAIITNTGFEKKIKIFSKRVLLEQTGPFHLI